MKIAFVVAEFNSEVTFPMEERARRHAESLGVEVARVVRVPGVYDMGPVVKALLAPAFRHRLILRPEAEVAGQTADSVLDAVAARVVPPR